MVSACPFLSLLHPPGDGEIRTACGSSGVGTSAFHVNKITPSVLFTARVGMLSCWVALFYVLSALRWWFRSTVNHDSRTSFIVACSGRSLILALFRTLSLDAAFHLQCQWPSFYWFSQFLRASKTSSPLDVVPGISWPERAFCFCLEVPASSWKVC